MPNGGALARERPQADPRVETILTVRRHGPGMAVHGRSLPPFFELTNGGFGSSPAIHPESRIKRSDTPTTLPRNVSYAHVADGRIAPTER